MAEQELFETTETHEEEVVDTEQAEEAPDVEEEAPETEKTEDEPEEEAPEEEKPTSTLIEKFKDQFPDDEFESDDDLTEALIERLDAAKEFEEKTAKKDQKIIDVINASPEFADLLYLMGQGAPIDDAMAFIKGESDIDLDEAKEGWKKSLKERKKAQEERQKLEQQTRDNFKKSFALLDNLSKERKLTQEQSSGILNKFDQVMLDLSKGEITAETYEIFIKGMKYDTDVKDEKEKAEVKGRNEAIKDLKTKKQTVKGDGLPHPDSAAPKPDDPQEETPESRIIRGMERMAHRPFG